MSGVIHLNAEPRSDSGKGGGRRGSQQCRVAAVVYGSDRSPTMTSLAHNDFIHELENDSMYTQVIELRVGERRQDVILRDLQRHPYKNKIMHADFFRIDENKPINIVVPIHIVNADTCVGVKVDGGQLMQQTTEIEIIALPKDLPERIEIDAQDLHLGETRHLTDIQLPEGVQIIALMQLEGIEDIEHDDHNVGVISVIMIREEVIEEEAPEAIEVEYGEVDEEAADEAEGEGGDEE